MCVQYSTVQYSTHSGVYFGMLLCKAQWTAQRKRYALMHAALLPFPIELLTHIPFVRSELMSTAYTTLHRFLALILLLMNANLINTDEHSILRIGLYLGGKA